MSSWRTATFRCQARQPGFYLQARPSLTSRRVRFADHNERPIDVRYASLQAGEHKTGHIATGPNEGILFFDNVFPLKLHWLFRLPLAAERSLPDLMKRIKRSQETDPLNIINNANTSVNVIEILPRPKEGGAFVKFAYGEGASATGVEEAVKSYLKEAKIRPWWNPFERMRARLVKGKPWIEDLFRIPSMRLKVEFMPPEPGKEPAELTEEQLYSFFRPYGKLVNIVTQPSDSKILPKFALLDFAKAGRAVMAKNCMHGYKVSEAEGGGKSGTVLRLSYEQRIKAHWVRDWIVNHPRIVIPIIAALVAGITVAIFDPIRTWFIKVHITRAFHLSDYRFVRWLRETLGSPLMRWFAAQTGDILPFQRRREEVKGLEIIWDHQKENIDQIQGWLMESADTFIIVQGPRGSGTRELVVDQALKERKDTLVIDCKPIQEARGDSATIRAAAKQVGYWPVFSWVNTISGWIDLAAQSATGVKPGFSETLAGQLDKIFTNTANALKQIALEGHKKEEKDARLTDDVYLEAHPERLPVVVIDNFLHKSQEGTMVYDKIAEWAALLTSANISHVVFLTHDVSFSKSLSKALPDRVFRQIPLSDCNNEAAKRFVISHLATDDINTLVATSSTSVSDNGNDKKLTPSQNRQDLGELDSCISVLGGRLTDLEFLARRLKSGETPTKAVNEIILQSANEILKMYIYGEESYEEGQLRKRWNAQQAWLLVKMLAASEEGALRYNEVLMVDTLSKNGGEEVIRALEQAEMISITSNNGRPMAIKPGKPVYLAAFKKLMEDEVLRSRLDLQIVGDRIRWANEDIAKVETELKLLGELPRHPIESLPRIKWLLGKLATSQARVSSLEAEAGKLIKVLKEQY